MTLLEFTGIMVNGPSSKSYQAYYSQYDKSHLEKWEMPGTFFGMAFSMTWVLLLSEWSKIANWLSKNSPKSSVQLLNVRNLPQKQLHVCHIFSLRLHDSISIYVSDFFYSCHFHPLPLRQVQLFPPKKKMGPKVIDSKHQNRTIKVHAFASCKTQQVELNQSTKLVGGWATPIEN